MKTYKIPQTDLVVSRIAYGCGHLSQPKLAGYKDRLSVDDIAVAIAKSKASFKDAFAQWQQSPVTSGEVATALGVVNTALESGITLFDHADIYGFGKCEAVFGEVLKQLPGVRDKIVIQSKCGIRFAQDALEPQPDDPHRVDFSREYIVGATERILKRLGTDYLDILLLHRPDALAAPEEVAAALDHLYQSGKVRYFGVSNHTAGQLELLKRYVRQPLVVNQLHVSLAHPYLIADGVEANRDGGMRITQGYTGVAGTLDYCRLHDIQIQAWSPLKNGANVVNLINPPSTATPEVMQAAELLVELGEKYRATPSSIMLAWLLRHPAGILPLIGTMNPQRVIDNCSADRIDLSREEWYTLFAAASGVPSLQLLEVVIPKAAA